jgi:hypothetical protein
MTFVKSMRAHSAEEGDTWREQDVAPTLNGFDAGGETRAAVLVSQSPEAEPGSESVLISSTADSRVRTSRWPASGVGFGASAAVSGMSSTGCCPSCGHDGRSLRMFPDCFPAEPNQAPTSVSYFGGWSTSGMAWPGGFWTRDSSASPSEGVVCSLSAVLETRPVPRKYWLSARAAAGILRRAEKRGKTLPPRLMTALEGLASSSR